MQLRAVSFDEETDIRFEFLLETTGKNRFCFTLIAKFKGTYRPGSAGKPDAQFIHGMTLTALRMWRPATVILDLRELTYTWGTDMDLVLDVGAEEDISTLIVGSETCLPAIGTLLFGPGDQRPATDQARIFDSLEEALEYAHNLPQDP